MSFRHPQQKWTPAPLQEVLWPLVDQLAPPHPRRGPPSSSRGRLAHSRARPPSQARRGKNFLLYFQNCPIGSDTLTFTTYLLVFFFPALVTIFPAWRVLAQTSQWCAHGKPSATWSSATWPNTASFKPAASCLPRLLCLILSALPSVHLGLARRDKAASEPPNALSSTYLMLCSTKWLESIIMFLFLYYYYDTILFTVYMLEMRRRENKLCTPYSLSLRPSTVVFSWLVLCPCTCPNPRQWMQANTS